MKKTEGYVINWLHLLSFRQDASHLRRRAPFYIRKEQQATAVYKSALLELAASYDGASSLVKDVRFFFYRTPGMISQRSVL